MASQGTIERVIKILLGVGGIAFAGMCAFAVSPTGRELMGSVTDVVESIERASNSPGTAELRELGCDQALVMPVGELFEKLGSLSDFLGEMGAEIDGDARDTLLVQCRVQLPALRVPSCEDIARTYAEAVQQLEPFVVASGKPGERECSGYYDAAGNYLGDPGDDLSLHGED